MKFKIIFKHLFSLEISWDGRESCSKVNSYGSNRGNIFSFLSLCNMFRITIVSFQQTHTLTRHITYTTAEFPQIGGAAFANNKYNLEILVLINRSQMRIDYITLFSGLKLTFSKEHQTGERRFDILLRAKVALQLKFYLAYFLSI